jgi:hypothetical protein
VNDYSDRLKDGDRVRFRDGEWGRYVEWSSFIQAQTFVFEMETPGVGSGVTIKPGNRAVSNWRSTYKNLMQDSTGRFEHPMDVVSLAEEYKECPW